jgi:tetratricopeptide (TPR) repeat protein
LPTFAGTDFDLPDDTLYQVGKKFDYFFLEALRLKENGKHNEAFNILLHASDIDSTSAAVFAELSNYYLYLEQDTLAIDALQKAVKYSPDNFEYKVSLADLYRELGHFPEAIRLYEALVADYPDKSELNFHLSNLYLQQQEVDKAIKSLDVLENNLGMNEVLSIQKYRLYLAVDQKEKALKEIEKLSAKFPQEAKYLLMIGDFYLGQDVYDKALLYYEKAHSINAEDPRYILSMINYYEQKGEIETAAKETEKALKNPSLDTNIRMLILQRYIQNLGQDEKSVNSADALFETLMEEHSQEKDLNMLYGQFLASQNKFDEAKFQFQVVVEANPEDMRAWYNLLNIALKQDSIDEIIHICDAVISRSPDLPEFYFHKSTAYYMKQEYKLALDVLLEGLKYIPEDNSNMFSTFYGQLGDLYHQTGQKEQAYQVYDKALEYNENNVLVLNNYAYFLSLEKTELDKAERMSGKCVKIQPANATYLDTYAWVFFQKENYSLAKFYIESAIAKGGENSSDILEHYGDVLYKTGNTEKAFQQWEKALEMKEREGEIDTIVLKKKIENKNYYETTKK